MSYEYANDGNVVEVEPLVLGVSGHSASDYTVAHDSLSRLVLDRDASGAIEIFYDDAGNRLEVEESSGYLYDDGTNRLDEATWHTGETHLFGYDDAGNVVAIDRTLADDLSLTVAADGTVQEVEIASGETHYVRDYRRLMLERFGDGGAATYTYSPSGEMIEAAGEEDPGICPEEDITSVIPYETYVYLGGRRIAMVQSQYQFETQGSQCAADVLVVNDLYWYISDKMDLPRAVYRASDGAEVWHGEFDAFGNPVAIDDDVDGDSDEFIQPFRLPGQFALSPDEGGPTNTTGGLHENRYRVYASMTGRYLQPDPLPVAARDPYSYVSNWPMARVDPDGLRAAPVRPPVRAPTGPRVGPYRPGYPCTSPCCTSPTPVFGCDDEKPKPDLPELPEPLDFKPLEPADPENECRANDPNCESDYQDGVRDCRRSYYSAVMVKLCEDCMYEEWWQCVSGSPGARWGDPQPGSKCAELQERTAAGER